MVILIKNRRKIVWDFSDSDSGLLNWCKSGDHAKIVIASSHSFDSCPNVIDICDSQFQKSFWFNISINAGILIVIKQLFWNT
jgi:uncharacterized membrane protein